MRDGAAEDASTADDNSRFASEIEEVHSQERCLRQPSTHDKPEFQSRNAIDGFGSSPYQASVQSVRLGIIGAGNMGAAHAQNILDGKLSRVDLADLCSTDENRLKPIPAKT